MKVIYQIENVANGKVYIGSSADYKTRKYQHRKKLNSNGYSGSSVKLQNAWNKYGEENFEFSIIDQVPEGIDMGWHEEQWILKKDSIKNGYNIKLPYTQQKFTDHTSYSIGKGAREKSLLWLENNAPGNLRKMSPEEWLEKRKENPTFKLYNKERIPVEDYKRIPGRPVLRISEEGEILETYTSQWKCERTLDLGVNKSARVCRLNRNYKNIHRTSGHIFYSESDFDKERFLKLKNQIDSFIPKKYRPETWRVENPIPAKERNLVRVPISIQNKETKEIKTFRSKQECAEYLSVKRGKVHELVKGIRSAGNGKKKNVEQIKGWILYKEV